MEQIHLFETTITEEAIQNVNEVLRSTWLNEGKWVRQFEDTLEKEWRFKNVVTTNSCTSALHLCLEVIGVGPGDEVILPAQTFIATGMAVMHTGAKPVFADIDAQTGNIDPRDIRRKIRSNTKAIIAVHWGGLPCYMDQIYDLAGNIPVIDDAAHAFGASITEPWSSQEIVIGGGTASDFTCFSLQAIKPITTGDGGIICVKDDVAYKELKRRKWFGFDKKDMRRRFEGDRGYMVNEIGYKYHMNDIAGAMGCGNLVGYKERLSLRQATGLMYRKEFAKVYGLELLAQPTNFYPSYWVFTMLVNDRENFIKKMRDANIEVSVLDRRIDEHPVFGGVTTGLLGQQKFDKKQISIPCHDKLTEDQVEHIIDTIKGGW